MAHTGAGFIKTKKYHWQNSNLAMFGTDIEKSAKKTGQSEPAWQGAGTRVGLQVWRIVSMKVTHWPVEQYGYFYNGDTYIVLNTFMDPGSGERCYDAHLWIGEYSTPDEYGTGKYKIDELCSQVLDNQPIQHRDVMDYESDMFRSYFPTIRKMEGGAESGFERVKPTEYQTRLFHFKGSGRKIEVREVDLSKQSLDDSDVFLLDAGLSVIQWNGTTSNAFEKNAGREYLSKLKSERSGKIATETVDAPVPDDHPFMKALPDGTAQTRDSNDDDTSPQSIHRVSDATGRMLFTQVEVGSLSRRKLDSNDVFVVDTKKELFVWIGKGASIDERRNSLNYAHNYLQKTTHPFIPVTVVHEASETQHFRAALT